MVSLDVLDFQVALDDALAAAGLEPALRRQAVKEARRTIDAMAFRFALMDERPLPEDTDHLRAIDAIHEPTRVAQVLVRRRPLYASVRRRRLFTTYTTLTIIALLIAGLAYVATSEESVTLAEFSAMSSTNRTFQVTEDYTRLYVDATVLHPDDDVSGITIFLSGPEGRVFQLWPSGDARNNYLRETILPPDLVPGEWTLLVDFNGGGGSVYVTLLGIQPTR